MDESIWLHELTNEESQVDHDQMQRRILDAAFDLFVAFGIRRTTIEDIAKKAGVGRPTVYRRFGDKESIVQAVLMRESRRMIVSVWNQVQNIQPAEELLVRSFILGVRTVAQHPLAQRLQESEPEVILPYLTLKAGPLIDIGHALTGNFVQAMRSDNRFASLNVDYMLEVLGRLFISIVITPTQMLQADNEASLERLAQEFLLPLLMGK